MEQSDMKGRGSGQNQGENKSAIFWYLPKANTDTTSVRVKIE